MSPEDLGKSRVDLLLYPRCQGEEIVRDLGGRDVETQMLFFDGVLLDVLWGIDGTKEVAMQVQASLRQTRRDRDALDGSCLPVVRTQRFLPAPGAVLIVPVPCAPRVMGVRWPSGMSCDSVDRERKAWKE
jgi:hypothetical protein